MLNPYQTHTSGYFSKMKGAACKVTTHQDEESVKQSACICERPRSLVLCRVCGWACRNLRAKRLCVLHPKTMYLMDLDMCPQCMASTIMLAEYPLN